jgi:predicted ATPase
VTPPWKEIYEQDEERHQDFAEAIATHEVVVAGYVEAGYELIEIPKATVAERVEFVIDRVEAWTTTAGR